MELSIEKIERVLRAAADVCADIAAEARSERRDWTDQTTSPLGRRRFATALQGRALFWAPHHHHGPGLPNPTRRGVTS